MMSPRSIEPARVDAIRTVWYVSESSNDCYRSSVKASTRCDVTITVVVIDLHVPSYQKTFTSARTYTPSIPPAYYHVINQQFVHSPGSGQNSVSRTAYPPAFDSISEHSIRQNPRTIRSFHSARSVGRWVWTVRRNSSGTLKRSAARFCQDGCRRVATTYG